MEGVSFAEHIVLLGVFLEEVRLSFQKFLLFLVGLVEVEISFG